MHRIAVSFVVVSVLLLALPVMAQEEQGNIAVTAWIKIKPGMEQQYEEGRKRHVKWHRQHNDPWTWIAWQVISGENTGMYGVATLGHHWSDFDTEPVPSDADEADRRANMAPYVESINITYWAFLPKVSRAYPGESPPAMSSIVFFDVRYGKSTEFNYLIGKFHEAIGKTNWPANYSWYALVNGGEGPTYALVLPRENWAAFKPQEKPFAQMLEDAYGRQEANSLLERLGKVVRSQRSQIHQSRPDLSYIPAGQ